MIRDITLRVDPPSSSLEMDFLAMVRKSYRIKESIIQRIGTESYLFIRVESKDANP